MLTLLLITAIVTCKAIDVRSRTEEFWMTTTDKDAKLHTRVVYPKGFDETKKYKTVMDRSPYGYDGLEWIADIMLPFDFVSIGQDMRGTGKSTSNFTLWHTDNDDGEQLGDWIVAQPWSNGEVYTFGASADGIASMTIPHNKPSWLKAQYVVWSSAQAYPCLFPNGAYLYHLVDEWLTGTVREYDLEDSLQTVWDNEAMTDWWHPLDMVGSFEEFIKFPSGFWVGWYDIFTPGNLITWDGYNNQAENDVKQQSRLLVDPLGHCQDGAEYFPQNLIEGRSLLAIGQMLEVFGVQPVIRPGIQNVTFYVMSSNDSQGLDIANYWTTMEVFPKFKPTSFYLHPDGSSNNEPVSSDSSEAVSTTYTYDPSNPIMGLGGNNLSPLPCGPLDQRASEDGRTDVLMFHTEPQPDNEALYLTGPIWAQLYVSTDAIDTDFTVKISDVFPTGEVRLLIDSAFRMRWREGGVEPVYTEIGEIYKIDVNLWNTSYALAPGHKFRFSISSSNYPRFSVNPNNGILLKDTNYPGQNITAQNTLYHSNKYQSKVILPVVNKSQLPQVHDVKEEILAAYPQLEKNINLDDIIQRANTVLSRH